MSLSAVYTNLNSKHQLSTIFNKWENGLSLPRGLFSLFILYLLEKQYFPIIVTDDEIASENIYDELFKLLGKDEISYLPFFSGDESFNKTAFENHFSQFTRLFYNNTLRVIISSPRVTNLKLPNKIILEKFRLVFKQGEEYQFEWIISKLSEFAYQRANIVEFAGQYAVRGGILDIYPFGETYPYRLEFFANTIESIFRFHPNSQDNLEACSNFSLMPASNRYEDSSALIKNLPSNSVFILFEVKGHHYFSYPSTRFLPASNSFFKSWSAFSSAFEDPLQMFSLLKNDGFSIFYLYERDLYRKKVMEFLGESVFREWGVLSEGFVIPQKRIAVLTEHELFQRERMVNPNEQFIPESSQRSPLTESLKYGDFLVHRDHGICRFDGIKTIVIDDVPQDVVILQFARDDRIYLSTKQLHKVFKFSASSEVKPELSALKGIKWQNVKKKVTAAVHTVAEDLVKLYRQRQALQGYRFFPDTEEQADLESSFPFQETADQLKAIAEIKEDMESDRIMDRLICGDVGFGKTEVAIRAAFKAVMSGVQVAILVPTTILSFQHFETFQQRLSKYGVVIEVLNRFNSTKNSIQIKRLLGKGKIDILIGTHRILSHDVVFRNLALLIIDEEHRFGVADKEKIKKLKNSIDVITMSATPIPRTLEFSLMGVRDLTLIETPPKERLPIQTKIINWDDKLISDAIHREKQRNGQIIFVCNDISRLQDLQNELQRLVPSISIRFAHGQMKGAELEDILLAFYSHKIDLLISTTIIESGIDIPNANTLFILDAQNFGLSQLYQLRGRVGRSHRRAYAYLI
ncbi:MAG TPA: DEAD/DEAH box helicase, partial [Candidatus Marinimicrobia bacterium]|nr:DEAD/DEAH box helicase [Candidatus Neomarinimicrobiota bacterium]